MTLKKVFKKIDKSVEEDLIRFSTKKKEPKSLCELCGKVEYQKKHHPIPKNIIKNINIKSELINLTVKLCNKCEIECHFGFLNFLINVEKMDGYNRLSAIKYTILKKHLKNMHPNVWKSYKVKMKEFIEDTLKEFGEENL